MVSAGEGSVNESGGATRPEGGLYIPGPEERVPGACVSLYHCHDVSIISGLISIISFKELSSKRSSYKLRLERNCTFGCLIALATLRAIYNSTAAPSQRPSPAPLRPPPDFLSQYFTGR